MNQLSLFPIDSSVATDGPFSSPIEASLVGNPFQKMMDRMMQKVPPAKDTPPALSHHTGSFIKTIKDYRADALPVRPITIVAKEVKPAPTEPTHFFAKLSDSIKQAVQEAGEKYQVPHRLIESIIHTESGFNPKAHSHAGAIGLMQLMPGTARELGVENPYDVTQNVDGGVRYFRQMLDRFGQDTKLALAAYNAGPEAVKRYGGIPPYQETQQYVSKVMKHFASEA